MNDRFVDTLLRYAFGDEDEALPFESPIEAMFALAWLCGHQASIRQLQIDLSPQHALCEGKYRADFLAYCESGANYWQAVIECDGRDYHHASWAQICRDRARDAELETLGIKVFRFPGTQIFNDPMGCVHQVIDYFEASFVEQQLRENAERADA